MTVFNDNPGVDESRAAGDKEQLKEQLGFFVGEREELCNDFPI